MLSLAAAARDLLTHATLGGRGDERATEQIANAEPVNARGDDS